LLTAEGAKLQRLKFAILFTIADTFSVKITSQQMDVIRGYKKLGIEIHSPLPFSHPCKIFSHPVRKNWFTARVAP